MLAEVNTTFVWNVVLTRADWSTSPYWQAGNSLNQFKNGWGRLTIRCFSISFNVNFRHLRHVFGLGRPLSEDFTGVTTSSRRYLWRRHLGFKMAAPEMTSTKTWGGLFGPHWGGGAIWRPFRFWPPSWMTSFPGPENWEWGHPRWRPEAEGPPYCASASMGTEKAALYYYCNAAQWRGRAFRPLQWRHVSVMASRITDNHIAKNFTSNATGLIKETHI